MYRITSHYRNGGFVEGAQDDILAIVNPATENPIGTVALGSVDDVRLAIAAAKAALPAFARTGKQERIALLRRLHAAVLARGDELMAASFDEYGAPHARAQWIATYAAQSFLDAAETLEAYPLTRSAGRAIVTMEAVGVAALYTPWNSVAGSICSKLASAIAAGCPVVVKPSEYGPLQAHIVAQAVHDADLPPGVFNLVHGRGEVVGAELSLHPDVAKLSFTGSTAVGKALYAQAVSTLKRVSLSLSGKSATILLDDADLDTALPVALNALFQNNGQACIAGSRLLVPTSRLREVVARIQATVPDYRVGDPREPATRIGPLASVRQFERVQRFIQAGIDEGAILVAGGTGRPAGLGKGYFVQPTVFSDVRNEMTIAREEIFGPVLCILPYETDEQAVAMANDSIYGLQAYVLSQDEQRAFAVASALQVGRVSINGIEHEPLAPFGGVKASGIGREFGVSGLEAFLEPKAVIPAMARSSHG